MPEATSRHTHTTQSLPAYQPPHRGIRLAWRLLIAGLLLTGLASLSLTRVCTLEAAGADEWAFGVRHEQRGRVWYHCEPWIRRAVRG